MTVDIDKLQRWVGNETVTHDDLPPFKARALAAALNRTQLPGNGDDLPACWQWLYFLQTPTADNTGVDGHPKTSELLPPPPLPRRMWAAGNFSIEQPLRLGTPAEQRSIIKSIDLKEGKSGTLVFVNVEHRTSQNGTLCLIEAQNLVYRDMPDGPTPLPPGEPTEAKADFEKKITPTPVLLFRYSALTYNSHRIHYDREYATREEHYPALLVQGPLLATLLAELVISEVPDADISNFSFRAKRPSFDTDPFSVCGQRDGDEINLWTADQDEAVGMSAKATLR